MHLLKKITSQTTWHDSCVPTTRGSCSVSVCTARVSLPVISPWYMYKLFTQAGGGVDEFKSQKWYHTRHITFADKWFDNWPIDAWHQMIWSVCCLKTAQTVVNRNDKQLRQVSCDWEGLSPSNCQMETFGARCDFYARLMISPPTQTMWSKVCNKNTRLLRQSWSFRPHRMIMSIVHPYIATEADIASAIASFDTGSSARLDGLRPANLKDLTSRSEAWTRLILNSMMPKSPIQTCARIWDT